MRELEPAPGLPETQPRAVLADSRGWLWLGLRYGGVSFTRDPSAAEPAFENLNRRDGLSSDTVWALCEDASGLIYIGTGRGLDILDPETRALRHLSTRDGLAGDVIRSCYADRAGRMWIGTYGGFSRLDPASATRPAGGQSARIDRLVAGGVEHPLPEWGAEAVDGIVLEPTAGSLLVEFVVPNLRGVARQYQFRLIGGGEDWSRPAATRSVNYAGLAPGRYRFEGRAVSSDGTPGGTVASVAFRVLPPFWQRAWFVALVLGAAVLAGITFHRVRLRRAVELERIRRRIAMDLHDDLGAGLSQVAILSEVTRRAGQPAERARSLDRIGELARRMRASMSDIVWAVDPRFDRLDDLVARVREMATSSLEASGVVVRVTLDPPPSGRLVLQPDFRRQVLLFCTEVVTNVARHANATSLSIAFAAGSGRLSVEAVDDGVGLGPGELDDEDALGTLRGRVEGMGGEIKVEARPGAGVRIRARVPLP